MAHSRTSFSIWLFISVVYLVFTAWAIHEALTCTQFLCALVIVFPGLPWYLLLSGVMDNMSETGFAITTVVLALVNVAILYFLLRLLNGLVQRIVKRNVGS